ncbi:hypothetical protein LTR28_004504 [Elasticomyces elasticus]|nr:hypothetical protein LTR28_004504 [Elasticomyces elasticus]
MNGQFGLGERQFRSPRSSRPSTASVPTIQQVVPGASAFIVLKADQLTGRKVQGVVGELLTRGNHPRGIKVRLQDGRVGRVHQMALDITPGSSLSLYDLPASICAIVTSGWKTISKHRRRSMI